MLIAVVGVAMALLVAHEAGHAVAARAVGGRWAGVVRRGVWAVGVRIRVDGLSRRRIAVTLLAAPAAELLVLLAAWRLWPPDGAWWALLGAVQWGVNGLPWPGLPTDGRRLWALWRTGRATVEEG